MTIGIPGEKSMERCSPNLTCDMDGYYPSPTGVTEYYWHCENPYVFVLNDGLRLCQEHWNLWNEDFSV